MTRIGVVLNSYERYGTAAGGIVHLFESAKRWRDCRVTVFAPEIARADVEHALPEAAFVAIPSPDAWVGSKAVVFLARTFGALFTIVSALRRQDAVYVISPFLPDILPAVAAAPRRTVAQVFHLQEPPGKRAGHFMRNTLAYLNERMGLALVRHFVRSVVVLNAVETPRLRLPATTHVFRAGAGAWPQSVEHAFRAPEKRSGAVCVGRIAPTKGIDDLIEAWSRVREAVPSATLTLVGIGDDDAYVASLHARLRERGLEDAVHFAGYVSNERKAEIVASARLFVTASREEGWGIALAEALALGIPCVTYDLPVFAEAFPVGRIPVPEGDVERFAAATVALLTNDERYFMLARNAYT
ncbi:MAG: glycosyltransferase family 4 protein, partial [Candidatus Eremiobacteraeota bacterium]|nr:glycosyltransferase family 4 protein [Candidatus Eremiobacteraeota bacterium]